MRFIKRLKLGALLTSFFMFTILLITPHVSSDPFSDTIIGFNPISQTVNPSESFSVDIYCTPGQPIKAFELRLSFDASLIQAILVEEGDIFNNYSTFFNGGTIDNIAGNIIDIYGLILGDGNVSEPGTLVTITFTSKTKSGTSVLEFLDVGKWTGVTNETGYVPITVNSGSVVVLGGSSPPSPPSPPPYFPPPIYEENHPPEQPLKPSGPTYVESGVEYIYSSSTVDVDNDQIRFKFDWGDGNISEWSDFVDSGSTVSMSHSWDEIYFYEVRVIAQDIYGSNSSWSQALNISVSQSDFGIPPVVITDFSGKFNVNETIVFDASGSYDLDGFIVSFDWDFGDGETGSGRNVIHSYKQPGNYIVTLLLTDNNGTKSSKSINVNISSKVENMGLEENTIILPLNLIMIILTSISASCVCLVVLFRDRINLFIFERLNRKIERLRIKLKK